MTRPNLPDGFVGISNASQLRLRRLTTAAILVLFAFGTSACGKDDEASKDAETAKDAAQKSTADERRKRHDNLRADLQKESFDLNNDGETDQIHYSPVAAWLASSGT